MIRAVGNQSRDLLHVRVRCTQRTNDQGEELELMSEAGSADDGATIGAVLAGDADRFEEIVHRYGRALFRVAESHLGHRALAEEAVQETFLAAFRGLSRYDSRYSFRTWLWTILINECRRRHKRGQRRERLLSQAPVTPEQLAGGLPSDQAPPWQIAVQREQAELLNRCLAELPDVQAVALRLRFFAGLQYQEIADSMQCSLSSAKNRVRWGLERLSAQLTPTLNDDSRGPS